MQLLRDKFMISADPDAKEFLPIMGLDGEPIRLARQFDPYRHSTQIGVIAEVPLEFSEASIDSHTLKVGDTVWFHHFVCQPKNRWMIGGKEMFQASWDQIWAKVEDGKLIPMNEWLFVEPILESEENTFLAHLQLREQREFLPLVGKVYALSNKAQEMGINPGDMIHFIRNADYEIEIDGKKLWRMKIQAVVAIEREGYSQSHPPDLTGDLIALSNRIIVKADERPEYVERAGIQLPNSEREKQHYGTVTSVGKEITEVKNLDRVCFLHGTSSVIMKGNNEFAVIKKTNLISVESRSIAYKSFKQ